MILSTRIFTTAVLAAAALTTSLHAIEDIAPVDPKPILEALKAIKGKQETDTKTAKARFVQEAQAAANNPARAVELWEEAIRATQFQGMARESTQFRDWKEKEGEALKEKEVQFALHLYFNWLALTLQKSAGAEIKTLLPAVYSHAKELLSDQAMMDTFDDSMKRASPTPTAGGPAKKVNTFQKDKAKDDAATKKMHDQILKQSLASSVFVQWMRLSDYITDVAPVRRGGGGGNNNGGNNKGGGRAGGAAQREEQAQAKAQALGQPIEEGATGWEGSPGSYDGIFQNIIMPELRLAKDVRVLEYWDYKLKHEAELATKAKLTFDIDKFNQVIRPRIIWSRDEDLIKIGQKNRAITDMFSQIKTYPAHPDAQAWVTELEALLLPPAPATLNPAPADPTGAPAVPGAQ